MASLTRSFLRPSMTNTIPLFLVPAFANASPVAAGQTAHFSTSTSLLGGPSAKRKQAYIRSKTMGRPNWTPTARPKIEKNKKRGVSAIRRTGPRSMRGLWKHALPEPVARDYRGLTPDYTESHDHGLWGFFDAKRQPMLEPDEESSHGRAWTYQELSMKSFEDLHKLYWVCVKEQNRTLTREKERSRLRAGYGDAEGEARVEVIRQTMFHIRDVLVDRQLSYKQAAPLVQSRNVVDILYEEQGEGESALEDNEWEDIDAPETNEAESSKPVTPAEGEPVTGKQQPSAAL